MTDAPPQLTEEQLERLTTAALAAGALDEAVSLPRSLVAATLARLDYLERRVEEELEARLGRASGYALAPGMECQCEFCALTEPKENDD